MITALLLAACSGTDGEATETTDDAASTAPTVASAAPTTSGTTSDTTSDTSSGTSSDASSDTADDGGGETAAPTTPPTEPAPALAPSTPAFPQASPAAAHGGGAKWNWYQYDPTFVDGIAALRGGATFIEAVWCAIDQGSDEYEWFTVDRAMDRADELGFDLYIKVRVGSCELTTQPSDNAEFPLLAASSTPVDLERYRRWVVALVERYAARGVDTWAIENEIDARNQYQAPLSDYPLIARIVSEEIRSAGPEHRIFDSGLSGTTYGIALARQLLDDGRDDEALATYQRFYARLTEAGRTRYPEANDVDELRFAVDSQRARRTIDAFVATRSVIVDGLVDGYQLHWYEPWTELDAALDWIETTMAPGLPIEAWELGVYWEGDDYDEDEHAAELARAAGLLLRRGVDRIIHLPVFYTIGGNISNERWRGLYGPTGERRAAAGVAELFAALSEPDVGTPMAITGDRWSGLAVDAPEGGSIAVVWPTPGGDPPGLGELAGDVTGLDGEPIDAESVDGTVDGPVVLLSRMPAADVAAAFMADLAG